jgi:hypothetical protein
MGEKSTIDDYAVTDPLAQNFDRVSCWCPTT